MHRVGVVGCGWIASFPLASLAKLSHHVHLVWVADPVRERAETIARQIGARALTDYRDGLQDLDCIITCTTPLLWIVARKRMSL